MFSRPLGDGELTEWTLSDGSRGWSHPPPEAVEAAVLYLIQESQKEIDLKDIESLLPEVNMIRDNYGHERKIIMVGGRVKVMFRIGYDALGVPVLPSKCLLSELYLLQAHQIDHGGINSMIMRYREKVWIIQAGKVAAKIKKTIVSDADYCGSPCRGRRCPPSPSSGWDHSPCSVPRLWIFSAPFSTRIWSEKE
jgi:hypothetical protein